MLLLLANFRVIFYFTDLVMKLKSNIFEFFCGNQRSKRSFMQNQRFSLILYLTNSNTEIDNHF